ncbi:MAG: hypothetical protein GY696_07360 [Gammaproteobacteria bacterium]|nr:hypothetical protein [Gammaproteobacteria bacterium]
MVVPELSEIVGWDSRHEDQSYHGRQRNAADASRKTAGLQYTVFENMLHHEV